MRSLRPALCSHPISVLLDFTKLFQIESNASNTAVGRVIIKQQVFMYKPIGFVMKTLIFSERNYSVHDK